MTDMHEIVKAASDMNNDLHRNNERLRAVVLAIFGDGGTPSLPADPPLGQGAKKEVEAPFNFISALEFQTIRQAYYLKYAMEMLSRLEDFTTIKVESKQGFDKRYVGGADPTKTAEAVVANTMSETLSNALENFNNDQTN